MTHLEKVQAELGRYEHLLLDFSAETDAGGGVTLMIRLKDPPEGVHEYAAPVHPRDIDHAQFPWMFQKFLYDCLHDYLCEMFTRNPQMLERT